MDEIDELSRLILWLIRGAGGVRITYCFIKMKGDETEVYWRRIKKALEAYIIAECAFQFKEIAMYYFMR